MASLNSVTIDLQVKGEATATRSLKDFAKAGGQVGTSVVKLANKVSAASSEWAKLDAMHKKGLITENARRTAQAQLAAQMSKLTNLTEAQTLAALRNAEASRKAAAAEAAETAKKDRVTQSYNQLRSVIDQSYAARMRLKQAADTLRAAERQGLITRQQAIEQLRLYRDAAQQAAAGGGFMGRSISRAGVLTQQAGYQVGDFIVQVQGGTNAFVAFGQQATQIAGTLTLLGGKWILIGSVLGVTIPLLTAVGAAFMRTRKSAEETDSAVSELKRSLDGLDSVTFDNAIRGVEGLEEKWSATLELVREYYTETARRARSSLSAELGLTEQIAELQAKITAEQNMRTAQGGFIDEAGQELLTSYVLEARNLTIIQRELNALDISSSEALAESYNMMLSRLAAQDRLTPELRMQLGLFAEELGILGVIREEADDLRDSVVEVNRTPLSEMFDRARLSVETMNNRLDDTLGKVSGILGAIGSIGFDTIAIEAETRALRAGQSVAQSRIEGQIAQERATMLGGGTGQLTPAQQIALSTKRAALEDRARAEAERQAELDARRPTSTATGGGASADRSVTEGEYLAQLRQEVEQKRMLSTLSQEQRSIEERVIQLQDQAQSKQLNISNERLRMFAMEEQRISDQMRLQDVFSNNIESALMSVVDGTKSVEDAFKGMLRTIILEIYKQQVASPIAQGAGSFLKSLFANANGNAFNRGNIIPFANGGVVGSPTTFPMANGNTGLMGEAGPEAIMPLKRGKDGKLGVAADGGGAVTVNNYFTVQANGDDSVKRIVRQQIPQIAEATKAAVVDSKRRGGSYGRAFG